MSASEEFMVPEEPEQLWLEDSDLPLKVKALVDLSESSPDEIGEMAEGIAFVLCDQDPLCIVEQANFDALASVVRVFDLLAPRRRRQLLDALCSSLTCLNAWIDRLLAEPAEAQDRDALNQYRNAFKAYLFFLHWAAAAAAREGRDAAASAAPAPARARGGAAAARKRAADDGTWDWPAQHAKVMKAVGASLNVDLWALFRPHRPDEGLLVKLMQLAGGALESPAAAKDEELAGGAAHVLAACALKYGQLESVASALVDALAKHEHTPPLVAELLRFSVAHYDDGRLAAAVIAEVAAVDPAEYERQQNATGEKAGVRSVAAFVEEMASRTPRLMAAQIALLLPHLGGKAWTLRSGIVTALGFLLHKAFENATADAADAQGAASRLRSKQHLLDVLCDRVRDQSSFTRKAVLQTWQYLAEARAIPLGHWQVVTTIATGRLADKSSLVRKEALRLLQALMLHNPFGPSLPVDRFDASLAAHRAMLDLVLPPAAGQEEDAVAEGIDIQGAASAASQGEDESEGGGGARAGVKREQASDAGSEDAMEVDDDEEQVEVEVEAEVEAEDPAAAEAAAAAAQSQARSCAEAGWDGSVQELQALVASLELAVGFAHSLAGCMPVLVQLLASSTVSDVQESIAMLLTCKQFDVAGAPGAIRKMLPLVFARDQAIKDRIVEALDQLYITGWAGNTFTSAQAARNLVALASGASLGELGSMEEVVAEFVGKGFLTPVMLHELWDAAARAAAAADAAPRARRDLRACLAVLSMAAAARPQAFGEAHVAALLRVGFAGGRAADALATRHACVALQRLADNFADGMYDGLREQVYAALTRAVVASPLPEATWYSAAEAAVTALYALHPAPDHLCAAMLRHLAAAAFGPAAGDGDGEGMDVDGAVAAAAGSVSAPALGRFFFVLGHVALEQLVFIERASKAVRRARGDAEKRAAEARAGAPPAGGGADEEEDINAELGVGSVAADAELDAIKDAAELQILGPGGLLAPYARLVSAACHHRSLLPGAPPALRGSALLALTKMMAVDPAYCEANLQLVFTLLRARAVEPALRSNLAVALGDLALRFPNLLEPWTEHVYRPLGDPDAGVRKNTMMVLTHLILNDMMKVKGHIARMAACLEDPDPRVAALAQLFFHELSKKEYKGTSPIYNLLPDILSNLSADGALGRGQFQAVMQQLLAYIKKDKQGDALVERLCQRLAATEDRAQWRHVAFCLAQLPLSDKGLRKLADCFKLYRPALGDPETAEAIAGIVARAKKGGAKPEHKALAEELEGRIAAAAAERAEEEAAGAAAAERAARDRGEAPAAAQHGAGDAEDGGGSGDEGMVDAEEEAGEAALPGQGAAEGAAGSEAAFPARGAVKPDPGAAAEAAEAEQEQGAPAEAAPAPLRRTTSRAVAAAAAAAATEVAAPPAARGRRSQPAAEEEAPAARPRRSGGAAGGRAAALAAKSSAPAAAAAADVAEAVAAKRRGGRRAQPAADSDSEGEGTARIAAVQAGMAAIKMEDR